MFDKKSGAFFLFSVSLFKYFAIFFNKGFYYLSFFGGNLKLLIRCKDCLNTEEMDITDIWKPKRITKQVATHLVNTNVDKFTHDCGGKFEFVDIVDE